MKRKSPTIIAALTLCLIASPLRVQSAAATPEPLAPASVAAKPAALPVKLEFLHITGDHLGVAVEQLQEILEAEKHESINVVFGGRAADAQIPELRLRNVTGPDALRLLATAANCKLEPILSTEEFRPKAGWTGPVIPDVIGYHIVSPEPGPVFISYQARAPQSSGFGSAMTSLAATTGRADSTSNGSSQFQPATASRAKISPLPGASGKKSKPPVAIDSEGNAIQPKPSGNPFGGGGVPGKAPAAGGFGLGGGVAGGLGAPGMGGSGGTSRGGLPGMMGGIVSYAGGMGMAMADGYGSQPPPITTRVYALAETTRSTPFTDIEKTLLEILELDGSKPEDAKISLHEKTNVLVVRAREPIHSLVAQLLESLEKNAKESDTSAAAKAERRYQSLISEVKLREQQMELKLQDAERQRARVEQEMQQRLNEAAKLRAQAEDESRKIQKELRSVQDRIKSQQK